MAVWRISRTHAFPRSSPSRVDAARRPEEEVNLKALAGTSSQRSLITRLVLLLTLAAGWTDALSYLNLDRVFSSFMTGNILFVGISISQGNDALLVRAALAVAVFLIALTLGSLYLIWGSHKRTPREYRMSLARLLTVEGLLLLAFAILWQLTGDIATHPNTQVVLLGIAAFGMGLQGALVASFNLPNIVSVALTAVLVLLGMRLAHSLARQTIDEPGHTSSPFLVALIVSYTLAALVTAMWVSTPFIPCVIVAVALLLVILAPDSAAAPVASKPKP
jgi:uncharacterized membrane protein YoaK (UPF0700 family)